MRTPNAFLNPRLHDKVVQDINESISGLLYIDNVYPIVHLGYNNDGESYPSVYMNDGTFNNYMIFPDSDVRAFTFFEMGDSSVSSQVDDEPIEYELSIVFWGNLQRINTLKKYDYTSEIIQDIVTILGSKDAYDIVYTTDVDEVFGEYSMYNEAESQTLLKPNTGFKITFKILGDAPCWSNTNPSASDMINTEIETGKTILTANTAKDIEYEITFSSVNYSLTGRCYDVNGNTVFFTVSNKTKDGFTVKANQDSIFEWQAILKL